VIFRRQDNWSASCCMEHLEVPLYARSIPGAGRGASRPPDKYGSNGLTAHHVCPKCQSKEVARFSCGDVLQRLFLRFRRKRNYRCLDCGHGFYDRPVSKPSSSAR
jgi:hypothetical protein